MHGPPPPAPSTREAQRGLAGAGFCLMPDLPRAEGVCPHRPQPWCKGEVRDSQNPFFLRLDAKGQQQVGKDGERRLQQQTPARQGSRQQGWIWAGWTVVLEPELEPSGVAGGPMAHAVQRKAAVAVPGDRCAPAGRPGPRSSSKPQGAGDRPWEAP